MTFPTGTVTEDNLNAANDSPADARADLLLAVQKLNDIINSYDSASGIAALNSSGKIVNTKLPDEIVSSTSANLTLNPDTSMVKIQNFINLAPVAYASLPGTPVKGDVAYLTTDGAAQTKEQLVFYNGSAWKYVADPTGSDVAAS